MVVDQEYKVRERDRTVKEKQKKYADQKRRVKYHEIEERDLVLMKQEKKNKFSTVYDTQPFEVEKVKGSMIIARQGQRTLARNSSEFKKIKSHNERRREREMEETEEEENEESEVNSSNDENENEEIEHQTVEAEEPREVKQRTTRSGRELKPNSRFKDYVLYYMK